MENIDEDEIIDMNTKYPSLPLNYVSLAQLQERWLQQQQKKQHQQQQRQRQRKQTVSLTPEDSKQKRRVHSNEKNLNNEGLRVDDQSVHAPRQRTDGNCREFGGVEGVLKSDELEIQARVVEGIDGMKKKISKKKKKYNNWKGRAPRVKGGLIGVDPVQMTWKDGGIMKGKDGGKEGCSGNFENHGDNNARVEKNVSVCMARAMSESEGNEENTVGLSGKSGGKRVSSGESSRNSDDQEVQRSVNAYMMDMLSENELEEDDLVVLRDKNGGGGYIDESEGNGDDQGTMEEGNVCKAVAFQENEVEEVPPGLGRKNGAATGSGFRRNSSYWKTGRVTKNKVELGKSVVEGVSIGEYERHGQKGKIGRGIRGYVAKERIAGNGGQKIARDFKALSLNDSRVSNVASEIGLRRAQKGGYENFGRLCSRKMAKPRDGDLVWVKKGELNTRAAKT